MKNKIKHILNKKHLIKSKIITLTIPSYIKTTYQYTQTQTISKHIQILQYIYYQLKTKKQNRSIIKNRKKKIKKNYIWNYKTTSLTINDVKNNFKEVLPWILFNYSKQTKNKQTIYTITIKNLDNIPMNNNILQQSNLIIKKIWQLIWLWILITQVINDIK